MHPAHTTTPLPFDCCHHTHSASTRISIQSTKQTQHHHLSLHDVTINRAYNSQLSTVYATHKTPPPPFGWCHHTHSVSTRNSIQSTQLTQHHHLPLDLVTISRSFQLATQYSAPSTQHTQQQHHFHLDVVTIHTAHQLASQFRAPSRHNNTTSLWMMSPYTQHSTRNSVQCTEHSQYHHLH